MITVEQLTGREKKKIVTFSINESVNERFIKIAEKLKINKSLFVEKSIIEFVEKYEKEI